MFKIKKVKPLFTGVITTARRYVGNQFADKGGLIVDTRKMSGQMNVFQTVVALGPSAEARGLKVGDVVKVNFIRYTKIKHLPGKIETDSAAGGRVQRDDMTYDVEIPAIDIDGVEHLFLQDSDIEYVVEEFEVGEGGLFE